MRGRDFLRFLAIAVFGLAASVYFPIASRTDIALAKTLPFETLPVLLVIIGFALCYTITRSIKPILTFGIIALLTLFAAPQITSIIPLAFFSIALLAYLCKVGSPVWAIVTAVASYALAFAVVGNPATAVLALIPSLVSLALFYSYRSGAMRVTSVLRMTLLFGAGIVAAFIAEYILLGEKLDIETLSSTFSEMRELIINETADIIFTTYTQVDEGLISAADALAIASESVSTVFNFLPAIIIIGLFLLTYVTHSLFIATIISTEEDAEKIKNALTFKMSLTSAIVFITAFLFSAALEYDGHDLYAVALANLYMILVPSFTVIAFGFVGALVKGERASCLGYLVYISLFLLLFNRPGIVLPLASFAGAVIVIVTSIQEWRAKRKDGGNR